MRAGALLVGTFVVSGLAGCEPDIGSGVYYCGPERACPPELACDDATAVCVFPGQVDPFACAEGSNDFEPDDDVASAFDIGTVGCGAAGLNELGCVDTADDVDHVALVTPLSCSGELAVAIRFPIAFQALTVDILDADGEVIGAGEVCDDLDLNGEVRVCAEADVDPDTAHLIRIRAVDGAPDCDGICDHNRYRLSIL